MLSTNNTTGVTVSDITYIYDGANAFELLGTSTQNISQRYTYNLGVDEPLALVSNTTSYVEQDGVGSITSLTNSSGAITDTVAYSQNGWGTPGHTGSTSFGLRFTARDFDGSPFLDYNRARYYDPITGRFISEDQIGFNGGENFYAYVGNSPIGRTDPFGYGPIGAAWNCLTFRYFYGKCFANALACKAHAQQSAPQGVNSQDSGTDDLLGQLANARNGQGTPYEGCLNLGECMAKEPSCIKMAKYAVQCGAWAISVGGSLVPKK